MNLISVRLTRMPTTDKFIIINTQCALILDVTENVNVSYKIVQKFSCYLSLPGVEV